MTRRRSQQVVGGTLGVLLAITVLGGGRNVVIDGLARVLNAPAEKLQFGLRSTSSSNPVSVTRQEDLAQQLHLQAIPCRVLRRIISPYQRSILVNVGSKEGIQEGQMVVAGGYLAGRVSKVFQTQAWVVLVSDPTFRLGVLIEGLDAQVILKGNVTSLLVDRVPGQKNLSGHRVLSSGDETGVANLPLGQLTNQLDVVGASGLRKYGLDRPLREEFVTDVQVIKGLSKQ